MGTTYGDAAERRFVWLLRQRGFKYTPENELDREIAVRGPRPDFYVETPVGNLLVEVKSFEAVNIVRRLESRVGSINPERLFAPIREQVRAAKRQLKPYADLGLPTMVVLDNWRQVGPPCNAFELSNALFGTLQIRMPLLGRDDVESRPPVLHDGAGQVLNAREGRYVSAVAWNLPCVRYDTAEVDAMTDERPMRLRIMHNPFAVVPLPIAMFNRPEDEHLLPDGRRPSPIVPRTAPLSRVREGLAWAAGRVEVLVRAVERALGRDQRP